MKKLKKLSLFEIENEFQVISSNHASQMIGGEFNNWCYFGCLEYFSDQFNCGNDIGYYMQNWLGSYGASGIMYGPDNYADVTSFTNNHFQGTAIPASDYSVMKTYIGLSMTAVMGTFTTSAGDQRIDHAVILQDTYQDKKTGQIMYNYYDPINKKYGAINRSEIQYAYVAVGCN